MTPKPCVQRKAASSSMAGSSASPARESSESSSSERKRKKKDKKKGAAWRGLAGKDRQTEVLVRQKRQEPLQKEVPKQLQEQDCPRKPLHAFSSRLSVSSSSEDKSKEAREHRANSEAKHVGIRRFNVVQ